MIRLDLTLTSFQISHLLWESWFFFFNEKTPENRNFTGPKWKKTGLPAYTNKFKALKSWLPHTNAPKCRFWALAILNNVQTPQGRYWRRYLVYSSINRLYSLYARRSAGWISFQFSTLVWISQSRLLVYCDI
jgi:hypothetical protein